MRRVVITGMGCVTPLGNDLTTTWKGVVEGKSGAARISAFDATNFSCQIAAEVKGFEPETLVEKKDIRRYDRFILLGLKAAREAWADSGLKDGDFIPENAGVILGVGIGGLTTLEENHKELLEGGPRRISPFLIPAMISNLAPGHIAIDKNLQGVNYTITSACTSGTHAVGEAWRMIACGLQDMMVTGGTESAITPLGVGGFARMRALTTRNDEPEKASRPFDKDRDGFLIGEGAGILVLEEMESAKKRGARIYAEVVGYGFSCDAYHITGQREGGEGAVACMSMAIKSSGLSLDKIRYINAHGTSTPINDPTESMAIRKVYGAEADKGLMVSSTKSMTGHLLGAAGGIEAVFIAQAIDKGIIPPTINLDTPDEGCTLDYV
ncbi:MAG: beta-ketoacyl-ACP synthase II, partial [Proteobacteria bacterium]|nr:beta-ketoacyl-ACP synthase II [Pseudomonadota bacterium]